jgi:hypothetical protein
MTGFAHFVAVVVGVIAGTLIVIGAGLAVVEVSRSIHRTAANGSRISQLPLVMFSFSDSFVHDFSQNGGNREAVALATPPFGSS